MVIEVVPARLYELAEVLGAAAGQVGTSGQALLGGAVGGPVGPEVTACTEVLRTAAGCLAAELTWLGGAVAAAADSWLGLDGSVRPVPGEGLPR
ncbi:hypothetical protein [Modestobacter roseus]|uniref:Excreted virulence factor EspC (Type VII ESX diderm) n=1 Tax=Modestobacter roseus TaxID=1181884 RepID=A0A562IV45_9ACTN|nr:hypothetical protein [Modestobacter roseus]MQA33655.1 hypothetical protein [Modestobacter roseus]TWH74394.1 hypothetical protein JD78_02932 [Modestobacter roseus]